MTLVDRQRQIPNGLTFHIPETHWRPTIAFSSFDTIVSQAISHIAGNRALWEKYPRDTEGMAKLVDEYNAQLCHAMGWKEYIRGEGGAPLAPFPYRGPQPTHPPPRSISLTPPAPLPKPPGLASQLASVAGGAETIVDWVRDGAQAVDHAHATSRAQVCSQCPMNGRGSIMRYFTVPAANAILKAINVQRDIKLTTDYDEELGVCEACSCPLKLKVHFPIQDLQVKLSDEVVKRLHESCWIPKELHELLHAEGA